MGKWLSQLRSNYSESLEQGTAKTAKTPITTFCQLVRHYGADHQFLLSYEEIMAGLDADDIVCLLSLDRCGKQEWAELLAHQLTRGRTVAPGGRGIAGKPPERQQQATMTKLQKIHNQSAANE